MYLFESSIERMLEVCYVGGIVPIYIRANGNKYPCRQLFEVLCELDGVVIFICELEGELRVLHYNA